jgi:signal transduction histidine kinase
MVGPWGDQMRGDALSARELLETWRQKRALRVGTRCAGVGVLMSLLSVPLDLHYSSPFVVYTDVVVAIGCFCSLLWSRAARPERFIWWPFYLALWLATFASIWETGGWHSPFLTCDVVVLFALGTVIQTRFSPVKVGAFVLAYHLFWGAITAAGWVPAPLPQPWYFTLAILFTLLGAAAYGLYSLMQTEAELARETYEQGQALSETTSSLVHAARLSELGTRVATTAHELSQPVQVIASVSDLVGRLARQGPAALEKIDKLNVRVREASARLAKLLSQLRDFSRDDAFSPQRLDVNELVRSSQHLAEYDLRARNAACELRTPADPIHVEADATQIQQVLLNLLANARDACAGVPDAKVTLAVSQVADRWARVQVTDNGPGIPLEVQGRVFRPYFSTKPRGAGSGLGLAICAHLVERHRGRILMSSRPGETVFCVDLPIGPAPVAAAAEQPALSG